MEQSRLPQMRAEVLDTIFNDWLLARFHSNLQRMDRANPLDLVLDDLEELCTKSVSKISEEKPAFVT